MTYIIYSTFSAPDFLRARVPPIKHRYKQSNAIRILTLHSTFSEPDFLRLRLNII